MEGIEYAACLQKMTGGTLRPGGLTITDRAFELCSISPDCRVLDAGCGSGVTLRHLKDHHGARGYGLDLSMEMLAEARSADDKGVLVQARMEAMPFSAGIFRCIVCECVLSHTDHEAVVKEFSRVIEREGVLVLSDLYRRSGPAFAPSGMEILDKEHITECLARSGFHILNWEDRTVDLKRLAAELVMSGCTFPPYHTAPRLSCDTGLVAWRGVGYYLLVARRTHGNQC